MIRRRKWVSKAVAGYTLLELLVSLAAGSLLLVAIGYAVQRLGQDWQQAGRSSDAARLATGTETTRQLLMQILPLLGEDGFVLFEGDSSSLTAHVQPPQAVSAAGLLKMTLSRRVMADGVAVSLKFTSPSGAAVDARVPEAVFEEHLVLRGLKDFRLTYVSPGVSAAQATSYWSPAPALPTAIILTLELGSRPEAMRIIARPVASVDGRCLFDPVSGDCRL